MANRSTRNKIKSKARTLDKHFELLLSDLMDIDMLADSRSEYITAYMPSLVGIIDEVRSTCQRFADGL